MKNLLEFEIKKDYGYQRGATIVGAVLGIVVGSIMIYAVGIPVIDGVVSDAGLTGITATVASTVLTLLGVVPVVLVAQLF